MAFRYEGYNWEGRKWMAVPAIVTLGEQIEEARPGTYATDGTVASRTHDKYSPNSDHRPDLDDGDVSAIDWGGSPEFLAQSTEAIRLSRDPRVKYVIHNGRIFSSYAMNGIAPYIWRPYSGANKHVTHAHLSVNSLGERDASPWDIGTQEDLPVAEAPLTDYEQAAIDSLLEDGIFTEYTVDEEGEVHAEVQLKKLAVFLQRITDKQEAADQALADAIASIEAGEPVDVNQFVKKGEQVTLT